MLQVHVLRDNRDEFIERLKKRNHDFTEQVDAVLALDEKRRSSQKELDDVLAEANTMSKEIGQLYQQGKADEANAIKAKSGELKQKGQELKDGFAVLDEELQEALKIW